MNVLGPGLSFIADMISSVTSFLADNKVAAIALGTVLSGIAATSMAHAISGLFASATLAGIGAVPLALGGVAALMTAITAIPNMAEGGVLTKPTLVQAGEAGPEGFFPLDVFFTQMNTMFQRSNESVVDAIKSQSLVATVSNKDLNIALTPSNA